MSLDDLIKMNKSSSGRGGGGGGGGGRGRGRSGAAPSRRFTNRTANRSTPYSLPMSKVFYLIFLYQAYYLHRT